MKTENIEIRKLPDGVKSFVIERGNVATYVIDPSCDINSEFETLKVQSEK